jgi:hypothetical protein
MEGSDKERLPDYNHALVNKLKNEMMRDTHSPTLILGYNVADKYITKENARDDEQGDSSPERQRHRLLQGV